MVGNLARRDASHEIQRTGALDLIGDAAVHLGRYPGRATGKDLAALCRELLEEVGIEVIDLFKWDVEAAARHFAVRAAQIDGSLFGFGSHGIEWKKIRFSDQRFSR